MAGWLVETDAIAGFFFHQQEAAATFNDGGNRDGRLPGM
jgi:hypothetical protein